MQGNASGIICVKSGGDVLALPNDDLQGAHDIMLF